MYSYCFECFSVRTQYLVWSPLGLMLSSWNVSPVSVTRGCTTGISIATPSCFPTQCEGQSCGCNSQPTKPKRCRRRICLVLLWLQEHNARRLSSIHIYAGRRNQRWNRDSSDQRMLPHWFLLQRRRWRHQASLSRLCWGVSLFLRQGLGGLMPADLSRFRSVRGWIATPVARRRLAVSLTDDLNRCLRAVSLRNLSWAAVVDLGLPGLGLFFTEPIWRNFDLILNTVALSTPTCIAAWFTVTPFSNIPITRALLRLKCFFQAF